MTKMRLSVVFIVITILVSTQSRAEELCSVYSSYRLPRTVQGVHDQILGLSHAANQTREAAANEGNRGRNISYRDALTTLGLEDLWPSDDKYGRQICGGAYAASVLLERARQLGADHEYLKRLAQNQLRNGRYCWRRKIPADQVLAVNWRDIDDPIGALGGKAVDDFAYLTASAAFYARDFASAGLQYANIANDETSLHRDAGRLMQIRILRSQKKFDEAYVLSKQYRIAANGRLKEWIDQQEDLIGIYSGNPEYAAERLEKVYRRRYGLPIENEQPGFRHAQAERDFSLFFEYEHKRLRRHQVSKIPHDWWLRGQTKNLNTTYLAVQRLARQYDPIDWIQAFHASQAYRRDNTWFAGPDLDIESPDYIAVTKYAYQKWQEEKLSHWALIVALRAPDSSPYVNDIITFADVAAKRAATCDLKSGEHILYAAVLYHAIRLSAGRQDYETAFRLLKQADDNQFYLRATDLFDAEKAFIKILMIRGEMSLLKRYKSEIANDRKFPMLDLWIAEDEKSFLAAARGNVVGIVDMVSDETLARFLNTRDGRYSALNYEAVPAVAKALWMRGFVFHNEAAMTAAEPYLLRSYPELKPYFKIADTKKSASLRRRTFTHMILRHPGLSPLIYGPRAGRNAAGLDKVMGNSPIEGNWWCSAKDREGLPSDEFNLEASFFYQFFSFNSQGSGFGQNYHWRYGREGPPGLYAYNQRTAERENIPQAWQKFRTSYAPFRVIDENAQRRWASLPRASRFLGDEVDTWSKSAGGYFDWVIKRNDKLPESLHRVVYSTRVACRAQGGNGTVSRRAFQMLHRRYPNSDWAALTPYWFDRIGR
jgi:hypothetical protein